MNIKENKFPYDSFIGGWFIPEKICNDLINHFKKNKKNCVKGRSGYKDDTFVVDKNVKDSMDLAIECYDSSYPFNEYRMNLQNCLNEYLKKYTHANDSERFNINEPYNIQYYPPNGGFKKWHYESVNKQTCKRNLVFMTYLNNVQNAGTEFKYQKIKTKCKKGLTLIWPTSFTHTHRGIISKKNEKYIITGWFSYT
jgi:hypothetical protein